MTELLDNNHQIFISRSYQMCHALMNHPVLNKKCSYNEEQFTVVLALQKATIEYSSECVFIFSFT